jgi:DNA polymerase V
VPVSIGIGPNKTLAKAATHYAKKNLATGGATHINEANREQILSSIAVGDVWGVGRRNGPKLRAEGITNAWQLSCVSEKLIQQMLGIKGRQMVAELNGQVCYPLQFATPPAKSIGRSRTFGQDVENDDTLRAAIADFATQASFKLRLSGQLSKSLNFFIATNRFKPGYKYFSREIILDSPTSDTGLIINSLLNSLGKVLETTNLKFYRAGVMLGDFRPEILQTNIFNDKLPSSYSNSKKRMQAMDQLNERFGKGKVLFASQKLGDKWQPRRENCSPRYLTRWSDLPKIKPI